MLNAKTLSVVLALASLVSLAPAALAESDNDCQLRGVIVASGSISTANGGRAEAQRRLLADGTELSMLTEYDQAGTIIKRLVSFEEKDAANESTASVAENESMKTESTEIASNR